MSKQENAPTPVASEATGPTSHAPVVQGDPADLGDPGKRALIAEREARKAAEKAAADAAAKLKVFEDAQKTDAERAAEALTAAQAAAEKSAAKALRYEVADEAHLPLSSAHRLVGSTKEELLADAEALKAERSPVPSGPRPDLTQGSARSTTGGGSPEADFAAFLGSQLGGQPTR